MCSHIEGDIIHYPLQYLPLDLFSETQQLRFVRVGGASALSHFPSLAGKHRLTTLVASLIHGLREMPSFDDLTGLKKLIIADATHVPVLPSLQHLKSLQIFAVFRRNEVCCNGYATGYCDLTNFQCRKRADEPDVQCVDARMPAEDHAVVDRVDGFLCGNNITQDIDASEPTRYSTDGICEGVLYRECDLDGVRGICYNGRMQVVHCDVFGEYEKMRRLQIARGVGDACDPEVEAWLGCSVTR
jgi:hypothetical protein